MFKRTYVLIIVAIATVGTLSVVVPLEAQAWQLEVDLSGSDFGDDRVCAKLTGGYGYGPISECTQAGPNAQVTFNIGNNIVEGENHEVCGYSGILEAIFNCARGTHYGGDEQVSISS